MSTISSQITDGLKRQRNVFNELHETIPLSFMFSNYDLNVFRGWYHWKLFNGAASFDLELILGSTKNTYRVKSTTSKFSVKKLSHDMNEVNFSVFIEDTLVMDEASVNTIIANNPPDPAP